MQDDLLHPELTVRETLNYAAQLRMTGGELTAQLRADRELELLKLMGIDHCVDTIVGDTRKKGISGGERKRLCVAIELLNRPKLLFLDEPTSGLDSSTALSVCEALKNLSDSGECTVVCTIHQPQPKIFNLFDNLILMKRGAIVWQGRASHSEDYLMQMNLPLPPETHMADFLLDVISPGADGSDRVEAHRSQHTRLMPPVDLSLGLETDSFDSGELVGHACEFSILFHRNMRQYVRRWDLILMNLVATSLLAVFICMGIWKDIGTGQASIATRAPSLFFTCVTQGILGSLQSVNSFPAERAIMLREKAAGAYHVSSYFAAKSVVDMISQLWPPVIFTCIVYFAIGYQPVAEKFFVYMLFMVLDSMAAISMAAAGDRLCDVVVDFGCGRFWHAVS
jgi:ATP-binding cassette subfamily G (WHITE) protein 2